MSSTTSIVVAGGGTAGHVSPMLAVAQAFSAAEPGSRITAIGTETGLETTLVPQAGFELLTIPRVPMPRRPSRDALLFLPRFSAAVKQAKGYLSNTGAQAVFGVGGYVCTPVYLAARSLKIPVIVHEANVRPGLANRVGAMFAAAVGTAFAETKIKGARLVGMPMRTEVSSLDRQASQRQARERLGLSTDKPTLVVTGGSSGAVRMNTAVAGAARELTESGIQILHITGKGKEVRDAKGELLSLPGYTQVEFIPAMADVYAAADLLLCRSGAGTVCEVAAVGLPAVFVPLPVGNGEQALNARGLVEAGAALLVNDADLTGEYLLGAVASLVKDPARLADMSEKSSALGIRDADQHVVTMIQEAIKA